MKPICNVLLLLLITLILTSCTTHYNGVKPISPEVYLPHEKPTWALPLAGGLLYAFAPDKPVEQVDSLRPTLKWEPVAGAERYDLIIYRGVPKDKPQLTYTGFEKEETKKTGWFVPGKEAYYREALSEPSHQVEESLQPDSVYVWSVRTRTGTNVAGWSTYTVRRGGRVLAPGTTVPGFEANNWWWPFSTPKQ